MAWYSDFKKRFISIKNQLWKKITAWGKSIREWIRKKSGMTSTSATTSQKQRRIQKEITHSKKVQYEKYAQIYINAAKDPKIQKIGFTPLMCAIQQKDEFGVEALLACGVDVDEINPKLDYGRTQSGEWSALFFNIFPNTALAMAVATLQVNIVKLLLDYDASYNHIFKTHTLFDKDSKTDTVLDFLPRPKAEQKKSTQKIIELIEKAANIVFAPKSRFFKSALEDGNIARTQKTLNSILEQQKDLYNSEAKIPPHFLDASLYILGGYREKGYRYSLGYVQHNPISYALAHKQNKLAMELLKMAEQNLCSEDYQNILHETLIAAAYFNSPTILEVYLQKNPVKAYEICSKNSGLNLLQIAAQQGNLEVIKYLIETQGMDINYRSLTDFLLTSQTKTALFCALKSDLKVQEKHYLILYLLNNGAKLDHNILQEMHNSKLELDFDKVNVFIEFLEDEKPSKKLNIPAYTLLMEKITKHNTDLKKKLNEKIVEALPTNMPEVLPPIILGYLTEKPLPASEVSDPNTEKLPPSKKKP